MHRSTPHLLPNRWLSHLSRQAQAGARLAQANLRRLESPLKVNFCVTYWCQYKCKTCNTWKRKPVDELTTQEVLQFVRKNRNIGWLDVTGGEIFQIGRASCRERV